METPKVSIVIPVYEPEKKVFDKTKEMLENQTVPVEIIEKWNNPEAVSMNLGIKEAKGDIIVILAQDCVPASRDYVEKLIKPLEDSRVSAVVSDLMLTEEYWHKRPFLCRIFTINDMKIRKPGMNLSSCAYRKKDLERMGLINENVSAIDIEFSERIRKLGKIERGNVVVYHLHPHYNFKKLLKTFFSYYKFNGIVVREGGYDGLNFLYRLVRAIPILGFVSIYYRYPLKTHWHLLPIHFIVSGLIDHTISIIGFWKGFILGDEEGSRNKEVLNKYGDKI